MKASNVWQENFLTKSSIFFGGTGNLYLAGTICCVHNFMETDINIAAIFWDFPIKHYSEYAITKDAYNRDIRINMSC